MRRLALALVAATLATGCPAYKARVGFRPEVTDRRLAQGKSDVVVGTITGGDAASIFVDSGGETEAIPRADVGEVDQREARRQVKVGIALVVVGAIVGGVGLAYWECDENDFPLFCPFYSEDNLWAGLATLGGGLAVGTGIVAIFRGRADQSRVDDILRGGAVAGWWVGPAPVAAIDGAAPGVSAGVRF